MISWANGFLWVSQGSRGWFIFMTSHKVTCQNNPKRHWHVKYTREYFFSIYFRQFEWRRFIPTLILLAQRNSDLGPNGDEVETSSVALNKRRIEESTPDIDDEVYAMLAVELLPARTHGGFPVRSLNPESAYAEFPSKWPAYWCDPLPENYCLKHIVIWLPSF